MICTAAHQEAMLESSAMDEIHSIHQIASALQDLIRWVVTYSLLAVMCQVVKRLASRSHSKNPDENLSTGTSIYSDCSDGVLESGGGCPFLARRSTSSEPVDKVPVKPYSEMPAPKGLPIIGTLLDFIRSGASKKVHEYCDNRHRQLGPIYRETLGAVEAVFVSDNHMMRKVFQNEGSYPRHMVPQSWTIYNHISGNKRGLFFMDGQEWSERRRSLNKVFMGQSVVEKHFDNFDSVVSDMLDRWSHIRLPGGLLPNLEKELYNWSIESLGTFIFGRRIGCVAGAGSRPDIHTFVQAVQQIFAESARMNVIPPRLAYKLNLPVWKRFVKAIGTALQIACTLVEEKVKEVVDKADRGEPVDGMLAELMLQEHIDEEELVRIVTDLFLAAADTTSHSMQWSLHLLSQNPRCQERILDEVNKTVRPGEPIEAKHFVYMPYVKAVVKEALRLYPVAPFLTRILDEDIGLGGYQVPAGTLVLMSLYTNGRDQSHFSRPKDFVPERWLKREAGTGTGTAVAAHSCLPFGMGVRGCIGRKIAEAQMYLLLTRVVREYSLEAANESPVGITMRMITTPSQPIRMRLIKRQ